MRDDVRRIPRKQDSKTKQQQSSRPDQEDNSERQQQIAKMNMRFDKEGDNPNDQKSN